MPTPSGCTSHSFFSTITTCSSTIEPSTSFQSPLLGFSILTTTDLPSNCLHFWPHNWFESSAFWWDSKSLNLQLLSLWRCTNKNFSQIQVLTDAIQQKARQFIRVKVLARETTSIFWKYRWSISSALFYSERLFCYIFQLNYSNIEEHIKAY